MAYKKGQHDTECKNPRRITKYFPQHETVYELVVCHASADESRREEDDCLYHAPENGRGHYDTTTFLYSYHGNGVLQSILPEKKNGTNESGVTLHKMQFDSLAHFKYFETPKTTNMFLKDIDSYKTGQSVTTYTYTDHLCTQAVEKIPVEFDGGPKH